MKPKFEFIDYLDTLILSEPSKEQEDIPNLLTKDWDKNNECTCVLTAAANETQAKWVDVTPDMVRRALETSKGVIRVVPREFIPVYLVIHPNTLAKVVDKEQGQNLVNRFGIEILQSNNMWEDGFVCLNDKKEVVPVVKLKEYGFLN